MDQSLPQQPAQNNPIPTSSESSEVPIQKKRPRKFLVISFTLFFIIFSSIALLGSLVTYASVDIPGITQDQEQQIKRIMFAIPLIPKSPEQILIVAAESNSKLTTYNPEFSFSGTLGTTDVTIGSLDLEISGPVDVTTLENSSFDLTVKTGVNYGGTLYSASGRLRKINETMYGKVDAISDSIIDIYTSFTGSSQGVIPDEVRKNLETVFNTWALYDLSGLDTEARALLKEQQGEQASTIEVLREQIQKLLLHETVLPEVVRMPDEDIAGVSSYHLSLNPSPETLRTLILSWYEDQGLLTDDTRTYIEESISAVEVFRIDVWFGKKDMIIRKLTTSSQISLSKLLSSTLGKSAGSLYGAPLSDLQSVTDPKIQAGAVITLRDVGVPVVVEAPSPSVESRAYSSLLQDAFLTEEQRQIEEQKRSYEDGMNQISSALLKYYVANTSYPATLQSIPDLALDLSPYLYKRSTDGKDYILYVELETGQTSFYSEATPYYGMTGSYNYPRQLSQYDFDEL